MLRQNICLMSNILQKTSPAKKIVTKIQSNSASLIQINRTFAKNSFEIKNIKPDQSNKLHGDAEEWIKTLDQPTKQKLSYIRNEISIQLLQNQKVPELEWLTIKDYVDMLEMTQNRRKKFYFFLHSKYRCNQNDAVKDQIRAILNAEREEDGEVLVENITDRKHIGYGIGKNSHFLRFGSQVITKQKNLNLYRGILGKEPPLIFDCEFANQLRKIEVEDTVKQIILSFSAMREYRRPFVMHICNLERGTHFYQRLNSNFTTLNKAPIHTSSKDVTDLYPAEKLVYLSPDAEDTLDEIDPNVGYIIGAIVDKQDKVPMTLAKAKRLNIQCRRLPTNEYFKFRSDKALPLNHVTKILLEAKQTGDWKKAFMHIPARMKM